MQQAVQNLGTKCTANEVEIAAACSILFEFFLMCLDKYFKQQCSVQSQTNTNAYSVQNANLHN